MHFDEQKRKVLFVLDKSGFGGVQTIALGLMNHEFEDVDVSFFFLRNVNPAYGMADLDRPDVIYSRASRKYSLRSLFELFRLVGDGRYDLLHLNGTKSIVFGYLVKLLRPRLKLVSHDHSSEFDYAGGYTRMMRFVAGKIDRFICVSERRKKFLTEACAIEPERIVVLNNFVDEKRFDGRGGSKRGAKRRDADGGNPFVVGYVGRLSRVKGGDVLIWAIPALAKRITNLEVQIAGEGPERGALQALADELGVAGKVRFLGYVPEPAETYAGFDVMVIPSRSEEGPISLYEAWMVGVPVVASDAPVIDERIDDYRTGLLFPSEDHRQLAAKVLEIYDDPELGRRLTAGGAETVRDLTAARYMDRLRKIYLTV